MVLKALKSEIFLLPPIETTGHPSDLASHLKILIPKQMLQRLSVAIAQVKAGNTSENLLNEIRYIIYYFYQAKEITKKTYKKIMNSVMNSKRILYL